MKTALVEPEASPYGLEDAARAAAAFRDRLHAGRERPDDNYVVLSVEAPSAYLAAADPDELADRAAVALDAAVAAVDARDAAAEGSGPPQS